MSTAVLIPAGDFDDDGDAEFEAIVANFSLRRPSRAAERREGREQIERGLGINRHRKTEREV